MEALIDASAKDLLKVWIPIFISFGLVPNASTFQSTLIAATNSSSQLLTKEGKCKEEKLQERNNIKTKSKQGQLSGTAPIDFSTPQGEKLLNALMKAALTISQNKNYRNAEDKQIITKKKKKRRPDNNDNFIRKSPPSEELEKNRKSVKTHRHRHQKKSKQFVHKNKKSSSTNPMFHSASSLNTLLESEYAAIRALRADVPGATLEYSFDVPEDGLRDRSISSDQQTYSPLDIVFDNDISVTNPDPSIRSGTVDKIIEYLTSTIEANDQIRFVFMLTFRTFISPSALLKRLIHRFFVPFDFNLISEDESAVRKAIAPIQINVFRVLMFWLDHHFNDFIEDPPLYRLLDTFLRYLVSSNFEHYCEDLVVGIERKAAETDQKKAFALHKHTRSILPPPNGLGLENFSNTNSTIGGTGGVNASPSSPSSHHHSQASSTSSFQNSSFDLTSGSSFSTTTLATSNRTRHGNSIFAPVHISQVDRLFPWIKTTTKCLRHTLHRLKQAHRLQKPSLERCIREDNRRHNRLISGLGLQTTSTTRLQMTTAPSSRSTSTDESGGPFSLTGSMFRTKSSSSTLSANGGGNNNNDGGPNRFSNNKTNGGGLQQRSTSTNHQHHVNLPRMYYQTEAWAGEYDVVQCPPGTPSEDCVQEITAHFHPDSLSLGDGGQPWPENATGVKLIYAGGHCHAPSCISLNLYNADTGELLCRQEPIFGTGNEIFNEKGYLAIPPCLWGSNEEGLESPIFLPRYANLTSIKKNNNTYTHYGEMASWQMRGVFVYGEEEY
eukprot:g3198.t1